MAVFSLSIIGICQVAFIRKNAFNLLIVLFVLASLPQILFSMFTNIMRKILHWKKYVTMWVSV